MEQESPQSFILISNIPASLHTCDLRKFFSDFVETEKFSCFHYRHRPEKGKVSEDNKSLQQSSTSFSKQVCGRVHTGWNVKSDSKSPNCCIVKLDTQFVPNLISKYHRKHWLDSSEEELPSKCFVFKVKIGSDDKVVDKDESVTYVRSELMSLPELRPPNLMPHGNVGTSTKYFLQAIKECRLPARMVGKLKLEFPQSRNRKFGTVPFDYGTFENSKSRKNVLIDRTMLEKKNRAGPSVSEVDDENEDGPDNDTCEEWERHEALHNDVQPNRAHGYQVESTSYYAADADLDQQEGTKEKTFEDEIELVWEKGGSGLNFYTDAQFWKEREGDFDEKTSDDWDVDMNVYYEKNTTHDKDAVDSLDMRKSEFLRDGKHTESIFKKKKTIQAGNSRKRRVSLSSDDKIGSFESSSRGFGGKIMAKSGWKPGEGLGKKNQGISTPILGEEEGQGPSNKSGMGYRGDPVPVFKRPDNVSSTGYLNTNVGITTAFSSPQERTVPERYDRSNPTMYLKFSDPAVRFCKGGVIGGNSTNKTTK